MVRSWSDAVVDHGVHCFDRSLVGWMIVAKHSGCRLILQPNFQNLAHVLFDGLRVGPTELHFQLLAPLFLAISHPPFSSQLTVGEIDEKIGALLHRDVMMNRVVLAVLERLESIDNNFLYRRTCSHHLLVEEQAMSA